MKNLMFTSIAIVSASFALAAQGKICFEENRAQYPEQVKYKVGIGEGATLFMEQNCFTYVKYDPAQLELIHENAHHSENGRKDGTVDLHAFRMTFMGASSEVTTTASDLRSRNSNYFIGNNEAKWASGVGSYGSVLYSGLYNGIDLSAYSSNEMFKYDFIVAPGADPSQIRMNFSGADGIEIRNGSLIIHLSTGDIVEQVPYSYQIINNVKNAVPCEYRIEADGRTLGFSLPEGYSEEHTLIIDPVVVAATFSGAPYGTTTYGHCATYDPTGNIYTAGECFNPGYPTQIGSFQTTFAGNVDIVVSCLNPNGSSLLWSTYLGGSGREVPNSLFATANGELYVLGASVSNNYPTTAGCYDATHNGTSGADDDIIITHVNNTGSALIGSTYIGGPQDDGGGWSLPWAMNGHDGMRGEIIVDGSGNAWVASFTASANFPTTPGTYDATLDGVADGVIFRLDGTCSTLGWSTFIGGSAGDCAYGLRLNSAGEVFCAGATCSSDFPATAGTYSTSNSGGTSDGYIARFNANGSSLIAATYFGTSGNEGCYFMDLDINGNPYVFGSSTGSMPVTAGVYTNPGCGNFISRFDPALASLQFSTVFGGTPAQYLEPQAFAVDASGNLYCAGFNSQANYPVTPANSIYSTQAACGNGSTYILVLSPNATQLLFGSFYWGWHVDGGTSRFSPDGTMYLGICIGGGNAPNSPWAYGTNSNMLNWDMYVLKVDLAEAVGINQPAFNTGLDVRVLPNPAGSLSEAVILSDDNELMTLNIYNSLGQLLWTHSIAPSGYETRVQLPGFESGGYTIEVTQAGSVSRNRFIAL